MSAVKNVIKDNYNMMLLKDYLREKIGKDSVIMVKGSRSASMEYIVDKLKL